MEEVDEREYFARVHVVEHRRRRVVVQKGEISANHGLISVVVELNLRFNYYILAPWSNVETAWYRHSMATTELNDSTHIPMPPALGPVPCGSVAPQRRHGLPPAFRTTLR